MLLAGNLARFTWKLGGALTSEKTAILRTFFFAVSAHLTVQRNFFSMSRLEPKLSVDFLDFRPKFKEIYEEFLT